MSGATDGIEGALVPNHNYVLGHGIPEGIVDDFLEILEKYYSSDIADAENEKTPSVTIDYELLESEKPELAGGLIDNPSLYFYSGLFALRSNWDKLNEADLRIKNVPNKVRVRDIRSSDVLTMITIEGRVKKATAVHPKIDVGRFSCINCDNVVSRRQPVNGPMKTADYCRDCETKTLKLDWGRSKLIDFQRIDIEESQEGLSGSETPQSIEVYVSGDVAGNVNPGEHITAVGLLDTPEAESMKTPTFDPYMVGNHLESENEDFEDIEITPEEEKQIKELAASPDIYQKIVGSIAPTIYGNNHEKLAGAMSLFGGVTKDVGGSYLRGDIHVLFVGDPGTAKSILLRYIFKLSPRGVYTSGKGSSAAGLTAAAVSEETLSGGKTWNLEAGALVLADKGIAAIDELDKMRDEDRSSLHEALEQQTVSIAKAGINAELKSRCALVAAANPKYGRFDQYESLAEQIELGPALISRFDLVFKLTDTPERERDNNIASHILNNNRRGADQTMDDVEPIISNELLRKYIAYARNNCRPVLTDEAEEKIKSFYVNFRNDLPEDAPVPATARNLQALVRLSEASAKIRLSETVDIEDAERAIEITEASLEQVGIDPETGMFDVDVVETGTSKSQKDRKRQLVQFVEMLDDTGEYDGGVPLDAIIDLATQHGYKEDVIEDELENLRRVEGAIYEPNNNRYKVV